MNRLEEYGYAGLYKALKHKYKYALSTNLPCVSRYSQFLALLCIFPELIYFQESCGSRFRLSSRLFEVLCLKCSLLLIVHHILEIRNDHCSLVIHCGHTPGTSDFANAVLFSVVNSRAELAPSPFRAVSSGIKNTALNIYLNIFTLVFTAI